MLLKDNKLFELPRFRGGSFGGTDRLLIPHEKLILIGVKQREDNGNIQLTTKAVDGPEELSGGVRFESEDRQKKDVLYKWLLLQVGKDIKKIYDSEFNLN